MATVTLREIVEDRDRTISIMIRRDERGYDVVLSDRVMGIMNAIEEHGALLVEDGPRAGEDEELEILAGRLMDHIHRTLVDWAVEVEERRAARPRAVA